MEKRTVVVQEPAAVPGPESPPGGLHDNPPDGPLLRLIRDRRVAFLIVGGINTLIGLFWFVLFHELAGGIVGYMATLALAHVCSVLCAFVLHRRFVFRVRGHVLLDLARFEVVNLGALAANAVLLPFFVEICHLPVIGAQLLATVVSVVTTYAGHRLFSFRRSHAQLRAQAGTSTTSGRDGEAAR